MSTSLAIPTDSDFMFLPAQCFSEGFNFEEWQLSNENEFGPLFSECFGREPPRLATEYDDTTMSAPTGMGLHPNASNDIHFPGAGYVPGNNDFTSEPAYPLGSFPSSEFTFQFTQPPYPSPRHYPAQYPTDTPNSLPYIGGNTPTEYHVGTAQAGTYGSFPCSSSHPSDLSFVPPAHYQRITFEPVQPTAGGTNPRPGFGKRRPRVEDGSTTAAAQAPPKKRRRVQASTSASRPSPPPNQIASSSRLPTSPSSPSASSSSTSIPSHGASTSTSTSPAPSTRSSDYVRLPDGRYRCRICTGKAAYADTEKDIVRHLDTAKAHNHERILCKDTVYRCPCGKSRLLGKRKDSQKRHVRTYIISERSEAIELKDQERLDKVDVYEARLRSEKLL